MPRVAREKYNCSTYHISIRGNNRQDIFLDDEDRIEYLKRLKRYKERYKVGIYAYCLMTNHIHLLVFDNDQDISKFMQGLNLSYVIYFNKKYNTIGHLFQERFTSTIVNNEPYLIYVSKYIHLNPVKAGMVTKPQQYKWSSYRIYKGEKDKFNIIDYELLLSFFAPHLNESRRLYSQYVLNTEQEEVTREEIASTKEGELDISLHSQGLIRISHERLIKVLEDHWNLSKQEIMLSSDNITKDKRNMLFYLIALVERLPYREVANLMTTTISNVSLGIKKAVGAIVKDSMIFNEREYILSLFENKIYTHV